MGFVVPLRSYTPVSIALQNKEKLACSALLEVLKSFDPGSELLLICILGSDRHIITLCWICSRSIGLFSLVYI